MGIFDRCWLHVLVPVLVLAVAVGGQGSVHAADQSMLADFVFESMGSAYCEPVPPEMPDDEIEAVYAQAIESGAAPLRGRMLGFMEGERIGASIFGTRSDDAGLAVVSSVMGPHPAGGHATLCLAMIQLGDVPAVPGSYAVTGIPGLDAASPGDVLVVGRVIRLEPSGRKDDGGRDIYRLANLGEAQVSGGSFTLVSIEDGQLQTRMEIRGNVLADDGASVTAFSLEATSRGEAGLDHIPAVSLDR